MFFRSLFSDLKSAGKWFAEAFERDAKPETVTIAPARMALALATKDEKTAAHDWNGRAMFAHSRIVTKS